MNITARDLLYAAALAATPLTVLAVTLPNTFTNGTVADAELVNANFTTLADAVTTLEGRMDAFEATGGGGTAWTPASNRSSLITISVGGTQTHTFTTGQVPAEATEVLVNIWGYSGNSGCGSSLRDVNASTTVGGVTYLQELKFFTYPGQNAIGFNSDNMWFPVTPTERTLTLSTEFTCNNAAVGAVLQGWR
jgi:hypothetical protein